MDIVSINGSSENGTTTFSVDTPSSTPSKLEMHRFCVALPSCLPFTVGFNLVGQEWLTTRRACYTVMIV